MSRKEKGKQSKGVGANGWKFKGGDGKRQR